MEFKQNKFLSPDKQMLTANPDINTVSSSASVNALTPATNLCLSFPCAGSSYDLNIL
jgi:hypothetical protein